MYFPKKFLESILPTDVVGEIRNCLFHNISIHGKHLKNEPNVGIFNECMLSIPKLLYPYAGPRIIYISKKKYRFVKFVYVVSCHRNFGANMKVRKLIMEYFMIENGATMLTDDFIRDLYFSNIKPCELI